MQGSIRRRWSFALGSVLAVLLLAGLAEGFLRLFPPRDLHPYLGEASPLTGVFKADDDFGVTYQSFEAFRQDNAERLTPYLPLYDHPDSRRLWAFFGCSFVQAPGMLGDTARDNVKDHRVFYLGKNESLNVRLAQLKLLIDNGLTPERVFIALLPVDMFTVGEHPLDTLHVTARGAVTWEPRRLPAPFVEVIKASRLALTVWVRTAGKRANPQFNRNTLQRGVDPVTLADLQRLFGNITNVMKSRGVPVTVILIPSHQQIVKGESFGFQEQMTALLRPMGYDICDVRDGFLQYPNKPALFIPDLHFSAEGNRLLLDAILNHVRGGPMQMPPRATMSREGSGPSTE